MSQLTNVLTRHLSAALATAGVLGGCAVPGALGPADGLTRGRAELAAGNYASARDAFRTWVASRPDDARAQLGLAAAYEGLDQLDSARAVYAGIAATRLPGGVRRQLEGRLRLLARREMAEAASAAVANEAVLSTSPPRPNSVAVLPFRYLGNDDQLRPLERGLSQLVVTDLSQVRSLVLLEREAVQRLLNEIRLASAGLADPATGARSGRLLRAERVIQGSFQDLAGERLRVDGSAVVTATATVAAAASADDQLRQLFDLEKAVVFELLQRLGIPLTDAERERIAERPTANLQAFLAFSRGLGAEDRDAFAEAAREYRTAARLDPGFRQASERAAAANLMSQARDLSLVGVATMLDPLGDLGFLTDQLNDVMGSGMRSAERADEPQGTGPPSARDPVGDVGGEDRLGGFGTFLVFIRRP
jgi:TolB-like protein